MAYLVEGEKEHRVRGVSAKKVVKKAAKKAPAKKAPAKKAAVKKVAKKAAAKKAAVKKVAKKAPAKKAPAKKVAAKKAPAKPFPSKAGKPTLTVDEKSQTVSVATVVAPVAAPVVEERRLVMPPPPRPVKSGKKVAPLKPIKSAPTPVTAAAGETPWSAAELKSIRVELSKELERLKHELALVEAEMEELIADSGEGAGDDQADWEQKLLSESMKCHWLSTPAIWSCRPSVRSSVLIARLTATVKIVPTQSAKNVSRCFLVQLSA